MPGLGLNFLADLWSVMDWVACIATLAGVWQLSSRKRSGFTINAFSSLIWVAIGLHSGLPGLTFLNAALMIIYARGYFINKKYDKYGKE